MKVGFIGLGKLGLPVSCAIVLRGHEVFGFDIDTDKADQYRRGVSGIYEPDMDGILKQCLDSGLHIISTIHEAVEPAEIVFVAVPTPSLPSGVFDNSYVLGLHHIEGQLDRGRLSVEASGRKTIG